MGRFSRTATFPERAARGHAPRHGADIMDFLYASSRLISLGGRASAGSDADGDDCFRRRHLLYYPCIVKTAPWWSSCQRLFLRGIVDCCIDECDLHRTPALFGCSCTIVFVSE